jgi:hypothetical protein
MSERRMKLVVILLGVLLSSAGVAAEWHRVSKEEIKLSGPIGQDSLRDYESVADSGYTRITVESAGGVEYPALLIARDIQRRGAKVFIDGLCASTCANFLALAVRAPSVSCRSLLAWHGSGLLTDMRSSDDDWIEAEMPETFVSEVKAWKVNARSEVVAFLKHTGIDSSIVDESVRVVLSAGIKPQSEKTVYSLDPATGFISSTTTRKGLPLWVPTTKALNRYGVDTSGFCPEYDQRIKGNMERLGVDGVVSDGE